MIRDLIIERLRDIKCIERNFPKDTMRWSKVAFNGTFIRDVEFDELNAKDLIKVFELILRRYNMQM